MPRRARRARRPRRRRMRKRRYGRRRGRVPRGVPPVGFPNNRVVRFRYAESLLLNPLNTGNIVYQAYRANSPFDPNATTPTGRNAMGTSQWLPFYAHYMVIGSRIRCQFSRTQSAANANSLVGILLANQPTLPVSSVTSVREQGMARTRELIGSQVGYLVPRIRHGFSPKRFFNLRDLKDNQEWLGAVYSDPPTQPPTDGDAYFHIFAGVNITGGSAGGPIECMITIDYVCLLSDPLNLEQSPFP